MNAKLGCTTWTSPYQPIQHIKKYTVMAPCRLVIVYHGLTNPGEKYIVWSCWIWSFPKMGIPPVIIHVRRILPYKPSILGYPHFRKPPYDVIIWFIFQYTFQIFHVCFLNTIQLRKKQPHHSPLSKVQPKEDGCPWLYRWQWATHNLSKFRSLIPLYSHDLRDFCPDSIPKHGGFHKFGYPWVLQTRCFIRENPI